MPDKIPNLYSQAINQLETGYQGMGDQMRQDVRKNFSALWASQSTNLQRRGLGGTSVLPAAQRQNVEAQQASLNRVGEMIMRQKLGMKERLLTSGIRSAEQQEAAEQQAIMSAFAGPAEILGGLLGGIF